MNSRHVPGTFFLTPNKHILMGQDPQTQVLFMWLVSYSDSATGECNPAIKTLAADCGMSDKTVDRRLKTLIELGLVQIEARYSGNERTTSLYTVHEVPVGQGHIVARPRDSEGEPRDSESPPYPTESHRTSSTYLASLKSTILEAIASEEKPPTKKFSEQGAQVIKAMGTR